MLDFSTRTDTDKSNLIANPDGAIKDNTGVGDGTAVDRAVYNDIYQTFLKIKRLYGVVPNGLPDNEINGFQYVQAFIGLASKNDYLQSLTLVSGVLRTQVKMSFMQSGEYLICRAAFNQGAETQIRGTDNTLFSFSGGDGFKTDDIVLINKSGGSFVLTRLVSRNNFDAIAAELSYLKAASQSEEDAGVINTKGTTPLTNKTTFTKRVNGVDSDNFLATPSQNGLLSMEDKAIIDGLTTDLINRGTVSGIEPGSGGVGSSLPVTGQITSAIIQSSGTIGHVRFRVTFANTMTTTNYKLNISIEIGSDYLANCRIGSPVFQPITATTCDITIAEFAGSTQSLKFHIDAIKL